MNFSVHIKTHAYVCQVSLWYLQDSYCQLGTNFSHNIQSQKSWWFLASLTICVSFIIIEHTALLIMALFSWCMLISPGYGVALAVISRPNISVTSSKLSQDLTFIWRISGAVDETGFIHVVLCACQISRHFQGNSMTRRLLLSYYCCDYQNWRLPK